MRTRLFQFAIILSASAGFLWSQATPTPPAASPAAPAPAPAEKSTEPVVTVQGTEPTGAGVSRTHDTLSVDFPDEDIRTILRNVADLFELNLVIPDTLQGKTSIKLRDVTWRQIFEVILTPVGYTYIEQGTIIKIVSLESLAQEPVNTEVFILNYARAADIQAVISTLVDTAAGGKLVVDARSNSLIVTERPSKLNKIRPIIAELDKATDQVMIESKFVEVTSSDVKNIGVNWSSLNGYQVGVGQISQSWTRSRGQTTGDGFNTTAGTTNGTTNNTTNNTTNGTTNGTTGSSTTTNTGAVNTVSTTTNTGSQLLPVTITDPLTGQTTTSYQVVPTNTNSTTTVNAQPSTQTISTSGTTSGTSSALANTIASTLTGGTTSAFNTLASLADTGSTNRLASAVFSASDFNIVLSALKTLSQTKIVSNPTIVTLNNTEASINVGSEFPVPNYTYNEQHGSFEVSGFTYKSIGINLKVTPQVNARGFIRLTLEPEVSQQNGTTTFGGAGGAAIPIIATRKAKTQVSMKDGYTMGIGGLIRSQSSNSGTKVPVLGSIPVLGRLFSSTSKDDEMTNLIIFITAKAINAEGAGIEEVFNPQQIRDLNMRRDELPGYRDKSDPFLPSAPSQPKK
ncbi:MAG: secretin N-terminal domain-containing protein [Opitutaceae bacterium]|jgi:type IV pilus assembly protein PilQ